jgi:hypothetical protein
MIYGKNLKEEAYNWFNNLDETSKDQVLTTIYMMCLNIGETKQSDLVIKLQDQLKSKDIEINKLKADYTLISESNGFKMLEDTFNKKFHELEQNNKLYINSIENKIDKTFHNVEKLEKDNKLYISSIENKIDKTCHSVEKLEQNNLLTKNSIESKIESTCQNTEKLFLSNQHLLEQKLINGHHNLEQNIIKSQHNLEQKLTTNSSKGIIGENSIRNLFSNIPGCFIYDTTRKQGGGDFLVNFNDIKILVESKNVDKVSNAHLELFKKNVNEEVGIDVAIFVAQKVKDINGRSFHIEIASRENKTIFIFYVSDIFNNPEKLHHAVSIGEILVKNDKTHDDSYEIVANISKIYDKIVLLNENSIEMCERMNALQHIINGNKKLTDDIFSTIKTIFNKESSVDKNHRLILDIVKRYTMLGKRCTTPDVVQKAILYGIKKTRAETIINRELCGIGKIKEAVKKEIDEGNLNCYVDFTIE